MVMLWINSATSDAIYIIVGGIYCTLQLNGKTELHWPMLDISIFSSHILFSDSVVTEKVKPTHTCFDTTAFKY